MAEGSPRKINFKTEKSTSSIADVVDGEVTEEDPDQDLSSRKDVPPRRHRFAFLGAAAVAAAVVLMRTTTLFDDGRGDDPVSGWGVVACNYCDCARRSVQAGVPPPLRRHVWRVSRLFHHPRRTTCGQLPRLP